MSEVSLIIDCIRHYTEAIDRHTDELVVFRRAFLDLRNDLVFALQSSNNNLLKEIKVALTQAENDLIKAFDAETSNIAKRIDDLIAKGGTDSPEFISALQAEVDKLKVLGSNGSAPPPPPAGV